MTDKKVWFITAPAAAWASTSARRAGVGCAVVATGRNPEKVSSALGAHERLLAGS